MKKFNLVAILALLSTFSYGQFKLVEKVEKQEGKVIIPYEKYELESNGLILIIHEDHSDPIVHVEVGYHVGSARESVRNSGFAHFFEHMMFQGSKNVADEEHFKIISEAGGNNNAYTSFDKTVYHETAPSNLTETMLWLEADRMGLHLDGFTQEKFDNQRDAVKNEKLQRYDNQPYGMVNEVLFKTLYANHPYEWTPIGYVDDLDAATFEDLRNFFLRWYGPNNATLVVAGDVNPEAVKAWVNKYFGKINQVPAIKNMSPKRPVLSMDYYVQMVDNIWLPLTTFAFPTVPEYHKDEAALDILASILGESSNSILYQKLVKTNEAIQASAGHNALELSGFLTVQLVTKPLLAGGMDFKKAEEKIREALADFEKREVTDDDIFIVKNQMINSAYGSLATVSSKAGALSDYAMMKGNGYNLQDDIDRYSSVTKEDVLRVYNKYIKNQKAVILRVDRDMTEKKEDDETPKSVNPHAGKLKVTDAQYKGLSYNPPADDFDRSIRPKSPAANKVIAPSVYKFDMPNGLKFIGSQSSESPLVYISFDIDGGHLMEGNKGVNSGTAMMTAAMMNEGTKNLTSEEFERALDKLGSNISFYSGTMGTSIYVQSLKQNLDPTLELLKDALFNPRFDEKDFERIKDQTIEGLQSQKSSSDVMAAKAVNKLLFDGILSEYYTGDYKSLKKIKIANVKDFYDKYYSPNLTKVVITGDIDEQTIKTKLAFLGQWTNKNAVMPAIPPLKAAAKTTVYLVDKPYASQSSIVAVHPSLTYDYNGDFYKSTVLNFALGGAFNSRINLNLREDKGYTYGSRSYFSGNNYYGQYRFSAEVKKVATDSAITELMKEINGYIDGGMKDEELAFTKSALLLSEALNYESPRQKLGYLGNMLEFNLPENYRAQQSDLLKNLSIGELNALAKKSLKPNAMHIVVVGHGYKIRPGLKKLGYDFKEITVD